MLLLELGLIPNLQTKHAVYMTHIKIAMVSDLECSEILVCMSAVIRKKGKKDGSNVSSV